MNATTTVTCPDWCTNGLAEHPCRGEHYSSPNYIPASAGRPDEIDPSSGATFSVIGVALIYSPDDGDEVPCISLHITGTGIDRNVDMRLCEGHFQRQLAHSEVGPADIRRYGGGRCSADGCEASAHSLGVCKRCYDRRRRT